MACGLPSTASTEPSCGASPAAPAKGSSNVLPCTLWSYSRITDSREQMAKSPSSSSSTAPASSATGASPVPVGGTGATERRCFTGASWSLELSSSQTNSPWCQTLRIPVSSEWPRRVSSVW